MPVLTAQPARRLPGDDERLLAACRQGDQEAWAALVDQYRNLVYSIPIKMGLHQHAPDIFQAVFLELLAALPDIREPQALAKWLIQVCYRKCLRCRVLEQRQVPLGEEIQAQVESGLPTLEDLLIQGQREQTVRHSLRLLSPRCERLVRMLFYEGPARPYQEIARTLGLAVGSIGFIRGRCLTHLRKQLERLGFK
ncbi:MAG TPA: sigma-70 family RNA polymerase sigma factor [Terriglobales bacterium]|jgi:RNA polymerase sigma factor (sigma-70 family)|nr:sigma-70 family RNA polymerase sigma factor [Terriglobales bacterium]